MAKQHAQVPYPLAVWKICVWQSPIWEAWASLAKLAHDAVPVCDSNPSKPSYGQKTKILSSPVLASEAPSRFWAKSKF